MPSAHLQSDNTSIEVIVCDWHMRRIFWTERLIENVNTGELAITWGKLRQRKNPSPSSPSLSDAPYNQEFVIHDRFTKNEVARCQRFVGPDQKTTAASKHPDPKELIIGTVNYHQVGKRTTCEHCAGGVPTTHDVPPVSLRIDGE